MKNPNKPTFERFSTFEELKGIKKPTVSEGVEPKNDLPDVESILKHKGMRSIEWAMREYGKAMVNHYKTSLRKEIDEELDFLRGEVKYLREKHPSDALACLAMTSSMDALAKIKSKLDTITPQ